MKIAVNKCYGGFSLSHEAILEYIRGVGQVPTWEWDEFDKEQYTLEQLAEKDPNSAFMIRYFADGKHWYYNGMDRDSSVLIEIVERMGTEKASGRYAELEITEIPDGTNYTIEEYDGKEWISEAHRTW